MKDFPSKSGFILIDMVNFIELFSFLSVFDSEFQSQISVDSARKGQKINQNYLPFYHIFSSIFFLCG